MTTRAIGARIPRNEDPRLLRGLGCFVDDVNPAGMLHGAVLRSPHAHARIVSIDAARARALSGVELVLTAPDLGDLNQPTPLLIPHPNLTHPRTPRPLAEDEVRFVGEPVAFVVARDRYVAEDAVAAIDVRWEPLPAVASIEAALADGAPLVHADVPGNRAAPAEPPLGVSGAHRTGADAGEGEPGLADRIVHERHRRRDADERVVAVAPGELEPGVAGAGRCGGKPDLGQDLRRRERGREVGPVELVRRQRPGAAGAPHGDACIEARGDGG